MITSYFLTIQDHHDQIKLKLIMNIMYYCIFYYDFYIYD